MRFGLSGDLATQAWCLVGGGRTSRHHPIKGHYIDEERSSDWSRLGDMLQKAITLARARPHIKPRGSTNISRMVAILTDGKLIFEGHNSYRTHPLQKKFSDNPDARIHIHAEVDAVVKAINYFTSKAGCRRADLDKVDLSDFKMYVARVFQDGTPALAKPCPGCVSCLASFNINELEYTK